MPALGYPGSANFPATMAEIGSVNGFMTGTGYKSFPGMALDTINFSNRLHLVYRFGTDHFVSGDGSIHYKTSDDYGATWSSPGSAVIIAARPAGHDFRDPFILVTRTGTIIVGYDDRDTSTGTYAVKIITSSDGGSTWTAVASAYTIPSAATGNEIAGTSQPIQLADTNHSICIFGNANDTTNGTLYSVVWVSTDDGATFPTEHVIAKNLAVREYAEPQGRMLNSGTLEVLLRSDTDDHYYQVTNTSPLTDLSTWTSPVDVGFLSGRPDHVEYRDGRLLLVCRFDNTTLYARWTTSTDAGQHWASLTNLTSSSTDELMYSAPVLISGALGGRVGVVYSIEVSSTQANLYYQLFSDTGA